MRSETNKSGLNSLINVDRIMIFIGMTVVFSFFGCPLNASAAQTGYDVDPFTSSSEFNIKYSFGSYQGKNQDMSGEMIIKDDSVLESVYISTPIQQFKTGKNTLDCHGFELSDF